MPPKELTEKYADNLASDPVLCKMGESIDTLLSRDKRATPCNEVKEANEKKKKKAEAACRGP